MKYSNFAKFTDNTSPNYVLYVIRCRWYFPYILYLEGRLKRAGGGGYKCIGLCSVDVLVIIVKLNYGNLKVFFTELGRAGVETFNFLFFFFPFFLRPPKGILLSSFNKQSQHADIFLKITNVQSSILSSRGFNYVGGACGLQQQLFIAALAITKTRYTPTLVKIVWSGSTAKRSRNGQ